MKLKFYMRGLGIGILVTWLIMSVINHNKVEAAKEQVREAYGHQDVDWVFADNDVSEGETGISEEAAADEGSEGNQVILRDSNEQLSDETGTDEMTAVDDMRDAKDDAGGEDAGGKSADGGNGSSNAADNYGQTTGNDFSQETENTGSGSQDESVIIIGYENDNDSIEIVVAAGDDSGTVSRKLYNAGIVDSASEFDAYLMQHGYDKRINKGTKVIYEDDSWQEIAEKLTAME